jgi:hypothetical protein
VPIDVRNTAGGSLYASPFVGPVDHTVHVKVDLSGLTVDEVDAAGYLKPGVPLNNANPAVLIGASTVTFTYGVTVEATKLPLATVPPTNTTLGTETADCLVAVCTHGVINRDVAEDNLGRAYTANELAAFVLPGSRLTLTTT